MTTDMGADVEKLRVAPEPFDRSFIDAMLLHHADAGNAAKAAESRPEHPAIKDLATAIPRDQQRKTPQMVRWRRAWFPGWLDRTRPGGRVARCSGPPTAGA